MVVLLLCLLYRIAILPCLCCSGMRHGAGLCIVSIYGHACDAMCLGAARKSATATAQATQCCQLTSAQGQPSASQPDIHTSDHSHKPKFEGL